jgi:predicted nucleic acid-binding protein
MTGPYLDTSALAKWYLNEPGSEPFERFLLDRPKAEISRLTMVELRCMLARRRCAEEITPQIEHAAFRLFLDDVARGWLTVHPLADDHAHRALSLVERLEAHSLWSLDALHLVIAEAIGAETLATANRVMARAAEEMGLDVALLG